MSCVIGLGQLEAKIMKVLWGASEPLRVRDVLERLGSEHAYTTIMTVLDNLYKKGWTTRESDGKGYRYVPSRSQEEAAAAAIRELLDSVADAEAALQHFARSATGGELDALRKALDQR